MRNVVKKFIGKNEKELNEDLVKMSMYYSFQINVTNCFKANEKGHVEKSVDVLRNQIFAAHWTFNSLEDAQEYAYSQLLKLNENSQMEEEKQHLRPYRPPLELAILSNPRLKAIFDTHYSKQPKKFIELFLANKELPIDEIIALFERETANRGELNALDVVKPVSQIVVAARAFVANYASLTMGGVRQ
jgi:hypothetical protein